VEFSFYRCDIIVVVVSRVSSGSLALSNYDCKCVRSLCAMGGGGRDKRHLEISEKNNSEIWNLNLAQYRFGVHHCDDDDDSQTQKLNHRGSHDIYSTPH
jgi:hypothetical protein